MAAAGAVWGKKRMRKRSQKSEVRSQNKKYYKVAEKRYHHPPMSFPRKRESRDSAAFWTPVGVYPAPGCGTGVTVGGSLSANYHFPIFHSAFCILRRCLSLLIPLFIFMQIGCSEEPVVRIGDVAQDFTLPSLAGENVTLSGLKGKNVFIFFWTQGCVFCQTDNIVHVNDIFRQGKKAGLEVFSINIAESKGDVREFVKQKGLIFPVLLDRDAKVTRKKYGVYMVPTLFLVGKDGVIKEKAYGYLTKEALWQFVNPYLKESP
jgi:peroxiredoxin